MYNDVVTRYLIPGRRAQSKAAGCSRPEGTFRHGCFTAIAFAALRMMIGQRGCGDDAGIGGRCDSRRMAERHAVVLYIKG